MPGAGHTAASRPRVVWRRGGMTREGMKREGGARAACSSVRAARRRRCGGVGALDTAKLGRGGGRGDSEQRRAAA